MAIAFIAQPSTRLVELDGWLSKRLDENGLSFVRVCEEDLTLLVLLLVLVVLSILRPSVASGPRIAADVLVGVIAIVGLNTGIC